MKKNLFPAVFFLAFCLFFPLFSQEVQDSVPKGKNLSGYVYSTLFENKFFPYYQELTPTGQDKFAENVCIDFVPEEKSAALDGQRTAAVLDFTQEDFFSCKDDFISFLMEIKSLRLNYQITMLFSALSIPSVPPVSRITGSEVFAENAASPDETFAVCVDLDASLKNTVKTGSFFSTSPLWLCKQISNSFRNLDKKYSFPNFISSLYRLGFIHGDMRMEAFTKNELPAIYISGSPADCFPVLADFLKNYSPDGTEEWDQHYFFIPLPKPAKPIVLNETICLGLCMLLALITLLSLCIVSFVGKQGEQNKIELLKNLYMIPLTLAVSLIGLYVAQAALKKFSGNFIANPVNLFGIKIIISMVFISIFYALHNILRLPTDIFIYSYIIQFISLFNIFLFSLKDLMLFVPFSLEYIFVFIFRKRKGLANLIILFVLMTLPFAPYAVDILQKTQQNDFHNIIFTNFLGNLSISLAIFPFQIIWLKILVRLKIYDGKKKKSASKLLCKGLISTASILAFCFAVMQSVYFFVYRPVEIQEKKSEVFIKDSFSELCSVQISQNEFSGMNTNHIKISAKKSALRYEVKIASLDYTVPIYDSIYAYDFSSEKSETGQALEEVNFIVPDYPPEEMTIDYAAAPNSLATVEVTSFFTGEGKNIILREKTNAFVGIKN